MRLTTPGAGGYGDVKDRELEMIAEDLLEEWITIDGAERDYGYKPRGN